MKFGIREVCDCTFYKYNGSTPSSTASFEIDTARMSTLESASTTVYAQGGRGFSRLAAWEGEKTLTFTVEDALLTTESFAALVGRDFSNNQIKITTEDYAGYYKIVATTFVRDIDSGADKLAQIEIPKAKLQSNFSIPMAPNGDPAAFTFTFDAFPVDGEFCIITIADAGTTGSGDSSETKVIICTDSGLFTGSTSVAAPYLAVAATTGKIMLGTATTTAEEDEIKGATVGTSEVLTNMSVNLSQGGKTALVKGSTSYWYII